MHAQKSNKKNLHQYEKGSKKEGKKEGRMNGWTEGWTGGRYVTDWCKMIWMAS
jgi:hypothetical protein